MRICPQCQSEMEEDFELRVKGEKFEFEVVKRGLFGGKRIDEARLAVCPKCGTVSMYVEKTRRI